MASAFDPFALLDSARVNTYGLRVFNGGGNFTKEVESIGPQTEFEQSTQNIYFKVQDNDVPIAFGIKDRCKENFRSLTDGINSYNDGCGGDNYDVFFTETLAISKRNDLSTMPVALVNERGRYEDMLEGEGMEYFDYEPRVILFEEEIGYISTYTYYDYIDGNGGWKYFAQPAVKERRSENITTENNDYWEGVFEYDINNDGDIPIYVPMGYPAYSEPSTDVNGKSIIGTKGNDTLNGKKKDDYIDGKNGNDILSGKKGDDFLTGKDGFDQLYGSKGNDYLNGGASDDILEGGSGADVFNMSTGSDTITDFKLSDGDKIAVPDEYINEFTVTGSAGNTLVKVEGYGELKVENIKATKLQENIADIIVRYI